MTGTLPVASGSDSDWAMVSAGSIHTCAVNRSGALYCWGSNPAGQLGLVARVSEATGGRVMEVWTTEPGVQFYTGNFLDGTIVGKGGQAYQRRSGFCLEPQHAPDSPNKPSWPSVVLKPGQTFHNTIIYKFSAQ